MGGNINGPSLIRVPDWVEQPLGRYYLYFADHKGLYIRMAFADSLTGPWTIYSPGVLDVSESLFESVDPPEPPEADRPYWAKDLKGGYLYAHVASPDVHVDHETRQIRMYYHGLLWNGDQQTRLANSSDGLSFLPEQPLLGDPYYRVFQYQGFFYAVTFAGRLFRSRNWEGPFEQGPDVLASLAEDGMLLRHAAVHLDGDCLYVAFSRIGECPERISCGIVQLSPDWNDWLVTGSHVLLEPDLDWEGAELPLAISEIGAASQPLRELRDPGFYAEDGRLFLLYCGAAEAGGIGLAEVLIDSTGYEASP